MLTITNEDCMDMIDQYPDKYFEPIKGWEHYYIGKAGEVYNKKTNRLKKAGKDNKGYLRVRLSNGRKNGSTKKIHRLVAAAFLNTYSESLQVNHINCIKTDNRVENLEMVTQSENTKHAWNKGRMKLTKKGTDGRFKC